MNDAVEKLHKIGSKSLRKAKQWYLGYFFGQIAVLAFAIIAILLNLNPNLSAVFAFIALLAIECLRWRSDYWKAEGDAAKRRLEVTDGLGLPVDVAQVADWMAGQSRGFLDDVTSDETKGSVFDSETAPGPRRLVENTQESAWWSKHLSRLMAVYLGFTIAAVLFGVFCALTASIAGLNASSVPQSGALVQNVGGIVCSVLMFVFSVNLVRLLVEFCNFFSGTKSILVRCETNLKLQEIEERFALQLLHDYQIERSLAPLLPTFIWKIHGDHLREQWTHFRPKHPKQ